MSIFILLLAQLRREWIMTKRYFFNFIGGIIVIFVLFILLFLGYKGIAGDTAAYGTGLGNLLVGYIMWMFALMIYQDISDTLREEAREGILEQLYMSPYGYTRITICRLLVSLTANMVMVSIVLLVIMRVTQKYLFLDILSLIPLVAGFLLPIVGISFILGGIQLLFKKIDAFMQLVQFVLIALVALPVEDTFFWARFLPGTLASHLVRQIMVNGEKIINIPADLLITTAVVGLLYLILGWLIFKQCERRAMQDGRLAHY